MYKMTKYGSMRNINEDNDESIRDQNSTESFQEERFLTVTNEEGRTEYICSQCSTEQRFKLKDYIINHMKKRHARKRKRNEDDSESDKKKQREEDDDEEIEIDDDANIDLSTITVMDFSNDGFVSQYIAEGKGIASPTSFEESITAINHVAHSTIIDENDADDMPPNQKHFHEKRY